MTTKTKMLFLFQTHQIKGTNPTLPQEVSHRVVFTAGKTTNRQNYASLISTLKQKRTRTV
jgi:hypothetical protein